MEEKKPQNKTNYWAIMVVIVFGLLASFLIYSEWKKTEMMELLFQGEELLIPKKVTKSKEAFSEKDTTQEINNDLGKIKIEDIDQNFEEIDNLLNNL